jgi:precorrin-3B C17-methyltransferase
VEPGITAMLAAAARVGAPLGGDFCAMSLSDNLKPWDIVEKRLRAAVEADFAVALYNPISSARPWQLGAALKIVSETRSADTPIILARAVGRPDEHIRILPLADAEASMADMSTMVIIGASTTRLIERPENEAPYVYTPRFYGVRP